MKTYKKIPYGIADFKLIQDENYYYVDKTGYIPMLEEAGRYHLFIRPRRFGKTLFLAVLEYYYDIASKEEFDALFQDTYIGKHPTKERNSYLVLRFNFSQVNPDPDKVEASFHEHTTTRFSLFGRKYLKFLDDYYFETMASKTSAHGKLEFLLTYVGFKGLKAYVLIDEYDNFANTILTTAGEASYHELTHGAGFFRFFFNVLKGATSGAEAGLSRLFVTGVSPVTMDDVTSGFNIGQNISLEPEFNGLLGFSEQNVARLIEYYRECGVSMPESDEILELLGEWYGNYCFSNAASDKMFNSDMVLYCVKHLLKSGEYPDNMIDQNVRVDYGKLRHLVVLDRQLNGNFGRLATITETGGITSRVVEGFPVERLMEPENFVSLLFYFGLLSYSGRDELTIPNRTVRKLMYGYLREGYRDVNVFKVDLWRFANLIRDMAYRGAWEPVFRFLADEVEKQTSIRDYLTGEKVIQTFLLAYLNVADYYTTRTEEEMGKGFAYLYLEPFWPKYPDVKQRYLIEIKYIKRGEFTQDLLREKLAQAREQLERYSTDPRVIEGNEGAKLTCLALVFCGWELKVAREFDVTG